MADQTQDPSTWKLILIFFCSVFADHVLPWTYHLLTTLSTALVSYFLFNWIRNYVTYKSEKHSWLKKFLFKK